MTPERKTLSGYDYLIKRMKGELPNPNMGKTIPMNVSLVEVGRVVIEAFPGEEHLNPSGNIHGGFFATVIDSVTAAAVHTMLDAGIDYTTIDLNVKFLKPIKAGMKVVAEGRLVNISRRLGVAEATLKDENGAVYAYGSSSCMIFR
jgi:uncharacterized protein (TIGR00369 family)